MKNKLKLFIPTLNKNGTYKLFSSKRMVKLNQIIPTKEELKIHFEIEKRNIDNIKDYKPNPYFIYLDNNDFEEVINEVKNKVYNYYSDKIILVLSSISAPSIIIKRKIN